MIELKFSARRESNEQAFGADPAKDEVPCYLCGKAISTAAKRFMIHVHKGGSHAVNEDEARALDAAGEEPADMGMLFVGSECLRRNPGLKRYAVVG